MASVNGELNMVDANILLVLGNGFDLAHKMSTSYKNILCDIFVNLVDMKNVKFTGIYYQKYLKHVFDENMIKIIFEAYRGLWSRDYQKISTFNLSELEKDLNGAYGYAIQYLYNYGNWWIYYFFNVVTDRNRRIGNGWVDFESEIHRVVYNVENMILGRSCEAYIKDKFGRYVNDLNTLREDFIPILKIDLMVLKTIIEFYLKREETCDNERKLAFFSTMKNVKAVLSYNYTHTYQNLYSKTLSNICYLHGEVTRHNLVLGTDETLPAEYKNIIVECASLKKLYQVIYYKLGNSFKNVFSKADDLSADWEAIIYGHSLTPADKYSLEWLFTKLDNGCFAGYIKHIIIYYVDEKSYHEQLTNLFQIIGQEHVLEYTSDNSIEFKQIK